ncbi:MAG: hypothetical protein FWH36_08600, partial [Lentimicrobiaceae bacterium]|nr:hypothetical protein [Lentimicrobiaceae bacterium]
PEPFYSAGVHTLVVFGFKQDTFVDVVFATGFDVGSYDNHYHCIFTFDEFKFMASFECMYGDTRPFGDFNNDDILDFAVYNWTSDSIFLYTLKDGIFEICTDYKIKLKYDVDLYLPLIDKTSTKINVFIDEQWIAIPSR